MSVEGKTPRAAKINFGTAVSTADRFVFRRFGQFAKLSALPFGLSLGLAVLEVSKLVALPFPIASYALLNVVPLAVFSIALTRVILTDEQAGILPRCILSRRSPVFLAYALAMAATILVPFMLVLIGAFVIATFGGPFVMFLVLLLFLYLFYLLARMGLVYPAVAVDQKLGVFGAWELARGNSLKLYGIFLAVLAFVILANWAGSAVFGPEIDNSTSGRLERASAPPAEMMHTLIVKAPMLFWTTLVSFVGVGLLTGIYASAYAQLTGWGAPRQDILERFE